jgi:hypothetical protein
MQLTSTSRLPKQIKSYTLSDEFELACQRITSISSSSVCLVRSPTNNGEDVTMLLRVGPSFRKYSIVQEFWYRECKHPTSQMDFHPISNTWSACALKRAGHGPCWPPPGTATVTAGDQPPPPHCLPGTARVPHAPSFSADPRGVLPGCRRGGGGDANPWPRLGLDRNHRAPPHAHCSTDAWTWSRGLLRIRATTGDWQGRSWRCIYLLALRRFASYRDGCEEDVRLTVSKIRDSAAAASRLWI